MALEIAVETGSIGSEVTPHQEVPMVRQERWEEIRRLWVRERVPVPFGPFMEHPDERPGVRTSGSGIVLQGASRQSALTPRGQSFPADDPPLKVPGETRRRGLGASLVRGRPEPEPAECRKTLPDLDPGAGS